ncbi:MAG: SHOCT domain-containing protein [Candidatus Hodarchaeota archaeon]
MSEVVKTAYRGIGGFFIVIFIFSFGVTGFALLLSGAVVLAISWVPLAFPEVLEEGTWQMGSGSGIEDPILASSILVFVALLLIALGGLFSALAFYIGKGAIYLDRGLSRAVDKSFPSIRELTASRSSDRIARLERLGELRDKGILTEEEFKREKAHILKEPSPTEKIPTCSSCGAPIEQDDAFCPTCGSKLL